MPRKRPRGSVIREPLSYALGTPAKVAAVRALAGSGGALTQRDVARRAGVQHRSIQLALNDLVALGLVERVEGGRDYLVRLNSDHVLAAPLLALIAAERTVFLSLRQRLTATADRVARRAKLASLVLFGSVARAADRVDSDCDVLVVASDNAGVDIAMRAFADVADTLRRTHGCAVRPVGYTLADARKRYKARAAPFGDVARDGLVLFGPPLAEAFGG